MFSFKRGPNKKTLRERFEEKFIPEPMSGCWLWVAATDAAGYGHMGINGKTIKASRLSWNLYVGHIPEGMFICHKCDTPLCVNPDHLFLGTQKDNMRDCLNKQRMQVGVVAYNAKLTEEDIRAIRLDKRKQAVIARDYGVHQQHISKIKRREIWRHVK